MKADPVVIYQCVREEWHRLVVLRDKAPQDAKDAQYDTLCRLWRRMGASERAEAGAWAKAQFHGAE